MLAAVGGLMTFYDRYKTAGLPAYRHKALDELFAEPDALLPDLVDTVIAPAAWRDRARPAGYAGLAIISLKTSLSFKCYLCAIKRMDNVAD